MKRIILTEKQVQRLENNLKEDIDPSEANRSSNSIETVIDGKRDVGFIAGYTKDDLNLLMNSGLKIIKLTPNKHGQPYVFYREGSEEKAQQLAKIANRNEGYLPIKSPEETYIIGILLGYNKEAVKQFVMQHFPDFIFH